VKVLITGITGFVGSHLAELCQSLGDVEVVGTYRWRSPRNNIAHLKDLALVEMDILDATSNVGSEFCGHPLRHVCAHGLCQFDSHVAESAQTRAAGATVAAVSNPSPQ